jgi:hypothetical protein
MSASWHRLLISSRCVLVMGISRSPVEHVVTIYQALPALVTELVAMGVVAIAATGDVASARTAQSVSCSVPVDFTIGAGSVRFGRPRDGAFSIFCSDFGISFASHAMASASVLCFWGSDIGSSKRRGPRHDTPSPQARAVIVFGRANSMPTRGSFAGTATGCPAL